VTYDAFPWSRLRVTDRPEVTRMKQRIKASLRRSVPLVGFVLAVLVVLAELTLAMVIFA
jgi:hypothetical protein